MKTKIVLTYAFCAIAFSGCATSWHRPNTTEAQFYQDRFECEQQVNRMYPPNMVPLGGGYQAPNQTNCTTYGNQTNCTTTPGAYTAPARVDANSFKRPAAMDSCLRARGYSPGG